MFYPVIGSLLLKASCDFRLEIRCFYWLTTLPWSKTMCLVLSICSHNTPYAPMQVINTLTVVIRAFRWLQWYVLDRNCQENLLLLFTSVSHGGCGSVRQWALKSIPADFITSQSQATVHTNSQFKWASWPKCISLDCVLKPEYPERTHQGKLHPGWDSNPESWCEVASLGAVALFSDVEQDMLIRCVSLQPCFPQEGVTTADIQRRSKSSCEWRTFELLS